MEEKKKKKTHRGRSVKCTDCKAMLNIQEEKELGNIVTESGVTVLYCSCGNNIILK